MSIQLDHDKVAYDQLIWGNGTKKTESKDLDYVQKKPNACSQL